MEQHVEPEHWDELTQIGQNSEISGKNYVRIMRNRFNQTHGVYVWQRKFITELLEDGSVRGYQEYGFNGKEVVIFDKERMVYIPTAHEGQLLAQRWNSRRIFAEVDKSYMEEHCVAWLKKYFSYGKDELERKVRPEVRVSDKQSDEATKLHCRVYGFYPRAVDVKWVRNGRDKVLSYEAKQILPHPDGTYQIRVTVEVAPKEGDSYSCHVDHSSLEEMLIIPWEPRRRSSLYIVIGVIAGVAALALTAVLGIFAYKRISGFSSPPCSSWRSSSPNRYRYFSLYLN
ncbi:class I histocompatibility antigen, F10 alpha chain-like isoform X2 [Ascaphus truei]|uniref:class I histocompatibility antigen, F10 alpha chain-like isoform X2 n=1 Tax=Ascaphus truei TaxID=8439 RepID=UPI003F59E370